MKRGSTLFLKLVVLLIGIVMLALCIVGLPWIAIHTNEETPAFNRALYPILISMFISAVPFFIALYQAWKVLAYIDKGQAFSMLSVTALKRIKYCAAIISGLYLLTSPLFYYLAQKDDAPGILLIALIIMFASIIIATFAALLQRLLQEAIDIKSENDLTV
ncbi:DUF2975 domain-containing protein [Listeria grandensis]|uniref:DUF2975 domain-containing protein n=1 Tax=Listeria grandensis TaxID=1494963 RepID=A0A7X0Y103_9LIST|nr:DUF2975 domain-containing protein [Listeria grandensis]MBC1934971.1 DUF2975 domain-containing protein [Listeria grandensis]